MNAKLPAVLSLRSPTILRPASAVRGVSTSCRNGIDPAGSFYGSRVVIIVYFEVCMGQVIIRGRHSVLPGCRWLHVSQPIGDDTSGVVVSTPCGVVSTRGVALFVVCWSCIYISIPDAGITPYSPRVSLAQRVPGNQ